MSIDIYAVAMTIARIYIAFTVGALSHLPSLPMAERAMRFVFTYNAKRTGLYGFSFPSGLYFGTPSPSWRCATIHYVRALHGFFMSFPSHWASKSNTPRGLGLYRYPINNLILPPLSTHYFTSI